jgi:hypothetical protein
MMTDVVMRVMMAVIGHMMVMGMMRRVMMDGGRSRRSDQQRRCDDNGQSREKLTH